MARNPTRRTGSKRSRASIRRKTKTYRKKKFSSKSFRSRKTVLISSKIKGIRKRLNNKPELKFTQQEVFGLSFVPSSTAYSIMWDSNGWVGNVKPPGVGAAACILSPGSGITENTFIGTQINSLWADVCLVFRRDTDVLTKWEHFSLVVAQPRMSGLRNGITYPQVPLLPYGFWDPKEWKIMYHKDFQWHTGLVTANTSAKLCENEKCFRFRIPLKSTVEVEHNTAQPYDTGRFFWDRPIVIMAQQMAASIFLSRCYTKFFYRDP